MTRTLPFASSTWLTSSIAMALLSGCPSEAAPVVEPTGVASLGAGSHDLARVRVEMIATSEDGLDAPSDVAIQSDLPGNIWITNRNKDGITIIMIGELVDWIDLSPMAPEGGLGGVAVDAAGRVYVTVMNANQVIRLSPAL